VRQATLVVELVRNARTGDDHLRAAGYPTVGAISIPSGDCLDDTLWVYRYELRCRIHCRCTDEAS
jgi:hypothetical protein